MKSRRQVISKKGGALARSPASPPRAERVRFEARQLGQAGLFLSSAFLVSHLWLGGKRAAASPPRSTNMDVPSVQQLEMLKYNELRRLAKTEGLRANLKVRALGHRGRREANSSERLRLFSGQGDPLDVSCIIRWQPPFQNTFPGEVFPIGKGKVRGSCYPCAISCSLASVQGRGRGGPHFKRKQKRF